MILDIFVKLASQIKKNKIPCLAVCNKNEEFRTIMTLERTLVSKRVLFKNVIIMPKGASYKGYLEDVSYGRIDWGNETKRGSSIYSGLKKICEENCDKEVETILKSRFFFQSSDQLPNNALHVFAENAPVNEHNQMLDNIGKSPHYSTSNWCSTKRLNPKQNRKSCKFIETEVGAHIMLNKNIDNDDKFLSGALVKIMDF